VTAASVISKLLQENWSLLSPAKTDIYWADTKVEAMDWMKVGKNFVIACYSPSGPVQAVPLSREAWQKTEQIMVDILVKVTGTVDDACTLRETMRNEVYRITHLVELSTPGYPDVHVQREAYKTESSELARLVIQVSLISFDIKS
jgi:hypothetical protein